MRSLSLSRAFRQIGGLTAVSRLMGFMRDIVFAAFVGAGGAADAFLIALKLSRKPCELLSCPALGYVPSTFPGTILLAI